MGQSTAGLAALLEGEDWRYVGTGGDEPDFGADYSNAGTYADLGFKLSALQEIRLYGAVIRGGFTDGVVFTLPEGYRPNPGKYGLIPVTVITTMGATSGGLAVVDDAGAVNLLGAQDTDTVIVNGAFPIEPPEVA